MRFHCGVQQWSMLLIHGLRPERHLQLNPRSVFARSGIPLRRLVLCRLPLYHFHFIEIVSFSIVYLTYSPVQSQIPWLMDIIARLLQDRDRPALVTSINSSPK